jgi:hypothetical protein
LGHATGSTSPGCAKVVNDWAWATDCSSRAEKPVPDLLELLERFCSGFAALDADGVVELFAPDADIVMVTSEESLLRGPTRVTAFLHGYA